MIFKEIDINDPRFVNRFPEPSHWVIAENPSNKIEWIVFHDGINGHDTDTERMIFRFVNGREVTLYAESADEMYRGFTD